MVQCKEEVGKESMSKEENHVHVSTRTGNHSRRNSARGTSCVSERDPSHAYSRRARRAVPGRAVCSALPSGGATRLCAVAIGGGYGSLPDRKCVRDW